MNKRPGLESQRELRLLWKLQLFPQNGKCIGTRGRLHMRFCVRFRSRRRLSSESVDGKSVKISAIKVKKPKKKPMYLCRLRPRVTTSSLDPALGSRNRERAAAAVHTCHQQSPVLTLYIGCIKEGKIGLGSIRAEVAQDHFSRHTKR
jgi:hypothetical protein